MKFDLIIGNPPYNRGLDLKILKEIYELGEKICLVHPTTWLYDNKNINKLFISTKELVKDNFILYEKVENANKLFGIALFTDVFITFIDKNQGGIGDRIYDIDIHGDSDIYRSLKDRILKYCKKTNLLDNVSYSNNKDWEVGFSGIRGNPGSLYSFIQKNNESEHINTKTKYLLKFGFDNESEAINFKDYLKTKIARFCLSIYKINQHLDRGELASVPYIPTYTRPWTDEDVAKELGLTEEELAWAINWIEDFYPEDAEKYKNWKI